MTTQQSIPLSQLMHSTANVRRTNKTAGIGELAASIEAHGLRQNLNVVPREDGKRFEVVAGGRRLRALKQLVKAKKLAKDAPISCLVLDESDDPAEISLVENAMRQAMHPDDQCEAFRALIEEKSMSVEDVAARFGVTPAVVRQRLKLANVSPKLRALYRKGEMTMEHVMALAISDDHAAQEEAWENLPDWNQDPSLLKQALTHGTVPLTDKLAKFIGIDAYIAAGGAVLRDLFDDEDEGYLSDRALVTRLATAKLEEAMASVRAEGWKWVKPELTRDYSIHYGRLWPVGSSYDNDDEAESGEDDTEAAIEDEADEPTEAFSAEDKARAGVRISIAHDGTLSIERGLIHPDDAKADTKQQSGVKAKADLACLSTAMVTELTAHRTAALRIELARNPAVALAATVHALALPLMYGCAATSCLAIKAQSETLERYTKAASDCTAHEAMTQEKECWEERLPNDEADLFAWCLAERQDTLLDLLAYVAGLTIDAVQTGRGRLERYDHADELAQALSLDMQQWWVPSVEGFYQRLPKTALAQAVIEAKVPPLGVAVGNLKKSEAARLVAHALDGSGWLPEPLRISPLASRAAPETEPLDVAA